MVSTCDGKKCKRQAVCFKKNPVNTMTAGTRGRPPRKLLNDKFCASCVPQTKDYCNRNMCFTCQSSYGTHRTTINGVVKRFCDRHNVDNTVIIDQRNAVLESENSDYDDRDDSSDCEDIGDYNYHNNLPNIVEGEVVQEKRFIPTPRQTTRLAISVNDDTTNTIVVNDDSVIASSSLEQNTIPNNVSKVPNYWV